MTFMDDLTEKTIHTEVIYNGKIITLQVDDVTLPNGKTAKREIVKHPGAVAIIPVTEEQKIVFVEQYRKTLERSLLEIPAGKIEQDENKKETEKHGIKEEKGYNTNRLK